MDNQERIRRIAVLSRRLRWALRAALALIAVAVFVAVVGIGFGIGANVTLEGTSIPLERLSLIDRLLLILVLSPLVVLGGWLVWSWDRLLRLYERGEIFGVENAAIIRRCGQLIIALALADLVVMPLGTLVLSRVAEETSMTIEPDLGLLLVGMGIIVVGHVMNLGAEMAEEASLTI